MLSGGESIRSLDEIPRGSRLCLYGAGEGGARFLALVRARRPDLRVVAFLDDGRRGDRDGVPVRPPGDLGALADKVDLVLITSSWWRPIAARLAREGAAFRVVSPELYFPEHVFTAAEQEEASALAARVEALLATPEDRELYRSVLANRGLDGAREADPYRLFTARRPARAEYLDFIVWARVRCAIDAGAMDGKNTLEFLDRMPPGGDVWAFEPDEGVLAGGPHAEELRRRPGVHLCPVALWSESGAVVFDADSADPSNSKVRRGGQNAPDARTVPAVTIDDFMAAQGIARLDFLKIDVEGAEPEVLAGAVRTLGSSRPQLAVCIYHRKEHLFSIPLRLAELLPGYVHHIGHYAPSFWDTVWYAIPAELADGSGGAP